MVTFKYAKAAWHACREFDVIKLVLGGTFRVLQKVKESLKISNDSFVFSGQVSLKKEQ